MTAELVRNLAVRAARDFFSKNNILEVRTAKAVRTGALEPYIDCVSLRGEYAADRVLATSPEMALKKIFSREMAANPQSAGIYEITPVFRDDRPGNHHRMEFTMVEWYSSNATLKAILEQAVSLISHLALALGNPLPACPLQTIDLPQKMAALCGDLNFAEPGSFASAYERLHHSLPYHLNELDLQIAAFNLLFDELLLPELRKTAGFTAVIGYPDILAAMAFTKAGIAERGEIYFGGLELANGYREEFRPDILRARWLAYNEIRRLRGVTEHPIDEDLLACAIDMQGVCGIAVGLERVLAAIVPGFRFDELP